ncbi:MAG: acetyltransferase [Pseudomonadota bacterium]
MIFAPKGLQGRRQVHKSIVRKALAIYGTGGFARELHWLVSRTSDFQATAFVDDAPSAAATFLDCPVQTFEDFLANPAGKINRISIGIGNPAVRELLHNKCTESGLELPVLIDPTTSLSDTVVLNAGAVVCAGTVLTVDIDIAQGVQINLNCTVGHDCKIGAFTTLSPGVNVSGNVFIGERVFIGTGASIINGSEDQPLRIGDDVVIAAGACVTRSLEPGYLYAGVPAQQKKRLTPD